MHKKSNGWCRRFWLGLFAAGILFAIGCSGDKPSTSPHPPQRIISLSPHITEILFALDLQKRLAAVTDYCRYPEAARQKERIGGLLNPNMEKILRLRPDLILGVPSSHETAAKLQSYEIRTVLLPNDRVQDIFTAIDSIGRLTGEEASAQALQKAIKDSLQYYRRKAQRLNADKARAMLVLGRERGTTRNISVIGSNNFNDSLWTMLGGRNVFGDIDSKFAKITREAVINARPELIIEFKFNEQWSPQKERKNRRDWQELSMLPAVKNDHIYVLTGNYTLIPGPRITLLVRDYFEILRAYNSTH